MKIKILLLATISTISIFAQNKFEIKTPQTYEIQRFGNIPVNLAVGSIDMSVPIFNTSLLNGKKQFNISLVYNSSGFMPAKKSNYVGLNWALNYGGMITRETNTSDDDIEIPHNQTHIGYLVPRKNNDSSKYLAYGNDERHKYDMSISNAYPQDNSSDKYHFNMLGITGYFYIGNLGTPIVVSNDNNLKIDISNYNIQDTSRCMPNESSITITDSNGTIYTFGGNANNLEITHNLGSLLPGNIAQVVNNGGMQLFSIKSWYLSKVEFINGENIIYRYKDFITSAELDGYSYCNVINQKPNVSIDIQPFLDLNLTYNQFKQNTSYEYSTGSFGIKYWGSNDSYAVSPQYLSINLTKKMFPEEIIINNNTSITFNYSTYQTEYTNSRSNETSLNYWMLSNINVKYKNSLIRNYSFEYSRKPNTDYTFLYKIQQADNKYEFEYYNSTNLPSFLTLGIDHWGYWNGQDNNRTLIPGYEFNINTGDYRITGTQRNSNSDLANVSLLKKVTYPTGGTSEFEYEGHDYSERIDRNSNSQFLQTIIAENGNVGGARIKKIKTKADISSDTNIKEYKYINNNNKSSGILTDYRRYLFYNQTKGNGFTSHVVKELNNNFTYSALSNSPIEYEKVLEYENGVLLKENFFLTYKDIPDGGEYRAYVPQLISQYTFLPANMNKNLGLKYEDMSFKRRLPKKEILYNQNRVKIKEISYEYTSYRSSMFNNIVGVVNDEAFNIYIPNVNTNDQETFAIYHYRYMNSMYPQLTKEETVEYFDTKSIKTIKNLSYDNNILLPSKKEIITPNKTIVENIKYVVQDASSWNIETDQKFFDMVNKNLINNVLSTTNKVENNIVSEIFNDYDDSGKGNIEAIYSKKGGNTSELISIDNLQISYKYGVKDKVNQIKTRDDLTISIIYGYNDEYPVAKLENVAYASIDASLIQQIQNTTNEDELLSLFNTLRNNHPQGLITTYIHIPLVGISKVIDPNGKVINYYYDEFNRLSRVTDSENNPVTDYEYHYKTL